MYVDVLFIVTVRVKLGEGVLVYVRVYVAETEGVGVDVRDTVKVGVGEETQSRTETIILFEITGGGASSESMPASFVTAPPQAAVTWPHHDTACAPAHVEPTDQFTTLPGFVPPALAPIYEMPVGTLSNILGLVDEVREKTFRLSYCCAPSFA